MDLLDDEEIETRNFPPQLVAHFTSVTYDVANRLRDVADVDDERLFLDDAVWAAFRTYLVILDRYLTLLLQPTTSLVWWNDWLILKIIEETLPGQFEPNKRFHPFVLLIALEDRLLVELRRTLSGETVSNEAVENARRILAAIESSGYRTGT